MACVAVKGRGEQQVAVFDSAAGRFSPAPQLLLAPSCSASDVLGAAVGRGSGRGRDDFGRSSSVP